MYYVYILSSEAKSKYYIGYTHDLISRLAKHNSGANRSTRAFRPWKIIYSEEFSTKTEAWHREQQIKAYKSGRAFKALIQSN